MIFSRKYNFVNNALGWGVFVVALLTYWLTLEPTASYWDCGEFIIQADKLEIGHPPGNPIFMLTARFFANFAFGDATKVALMVNAMSGLLSALTILLLFWTITHLVRRLLVRDADAEPSRAQYWAIMGSGVVGALAYTWSDTFWFSAVEGEVYAFSSFCTALVFWLILKWENRADMAHSDRYLVLIAYIIGVSIAVHLLNLLCIPAIVLVYAFRRFKNMNIGKSMLALLVSFAIIVGVLYGLVPGFIKVSGWFELFFVNTLGWSYNAGVLVYALVTLGVMVWTLWELNRDRSEAGIRISVMLISLLSGLLFIGGNVWIWVLLIAALAFFLFFKWKKSLPVRWLGIAAWSVAVIFVGYSSYALILIRSSANTPMNQNAPDNVFDLSSYLNREQYGQTPLLYGETFNSSPKQEIKGYTSRFQDFGIDDAPAYATIINKGKAQYAKAVKGAEPRSNDDFLSVGEQQRNSDLLARGKDAYLLYDYEGEYVMNPELNMLLPRIYSSAPSQKPYYSYWVPSLANPDEMQMVELSAYDPDTQTDVPQLNVYDYPEQNQQTGAYYLPQERRQKPTFWQNVEYFLNYQVNHMYWRYFLWNFAGRQNDINNQLGEKDAGNWITGIAPIDNARLGDQSLLPDEYGKDNKGHNVFYMLPLILGLIGLLWQAFAGKRGIEQFWVVFFLFFMTGLAIVLYLNQPPNQPRERDYAYAGSFYAYAIWIGMGVAAMWRGAMLLLKAKAQGNAKKDAKQAVAAESEAETATGRKSVIAAVVACALGLIVPLQMVSQTWDDHDRSGRTAARDYAINYLESLEPNAIIFCNGDNDTFPLWYAQEVEGVRPDVKIINLSYLGSDWYANQQRLQTYDAPGVDFTATPADYAYHRRDVVYNDGSASQTPVTLVDALKALYSDKAVKADANYASIPFANAYIPVDKATVLKRGLVPGGKEGSVVDRIPVNLNTMTLGQTLMLDIIATNAANGWKRPIYWAMTVGSDNYSQFMPYLRSTGMAYQLVPYKADMATDTEKSYPVVMNKYRWGGADKLTPYFDETAGRMLAGVRMTMLDLATSLIMEGDQLMALRDEAEGQRRAQLDKQARAKYAQAVKVLDRFTAKLPGGVRPYSFTDVITLGQDYCILGRALGNKAYTAKGLKVLADGMKRYAQNVRYVSALMQKFGAGYSPDEQAGTVKVTANATLTPENAYIMSSYYHLVLLYEEYGGKAAAAKVLRESRVSDKLLDELKRYYQLDTDPQAAAQYMQQKGGGAADSDMPSDEEVLTELCKWAEIVVELQGKSAADYAAASDIELQVDSTFMAVIEHLGVTPEELSANFEIFQKVDWDRQRRLSEELIRNHPELLEK